MWCLMSLNWHGSDALTNNKTIIHRPKKLIGFWSDIWPQAYANRFHFPLHLFLSSIAIDRYGNLMYLWRRYARTEIWPISSSVHFVDRNSLKQFVTIATASNVKASHSINVVCECVFCAILNTTLRSICAAHILYSYLDLLFQSFGNASFHVRCCIRHRSCSC